MTAYDPSVRKAATAASEAASRAERVSMGLALACGAAGQAARSAYLIFASWLLGEFEGVAKNMADDPPRNDFTQPTEQRRPHRRWEVNPTAEAVPDDVLGAVWDLARVLDRANASLEAHLRAFERYQGAALAGEVDLARARLDEASRFANASVTELRLLSALAEHASRVPAFRKVAIGPPSIALPLQLLPEAVLAWTYVIGVPIDRLEQSLASTDAIALYSRGWESGSEPAEAFQDLGSTSRTFADALENWNLSPAETPVG